MSKRINANELPDYPAGTRFTTPDAMGTVYTLESARYEAPFVGIVYTIPGLSRSTFYRLGRSTILLIGA